VSSVHGASKSIKDLHQELVALQSVLAQLKTFLENQTALGPFKETSALVETNGFCQAKLEGLLAKLEHLGEGRKFRQRWRNLKWPLNEAQNNETVVVLHRCSQTYSLSLTVEGW
jgi:hypothetical protein